MGNIFSGVGNLVMRFFRIENHDELGDDDGEADHAGNIADSQTGDGVLGNSAGNIADSQTGDGVLGNSDQQRRITGVGEICISYSLLDLSLSADKLRATCRLKMPSNEMPEYDVPSNHPIVNLLVKEANSAFCIKMMRECAHRNILHASLVVDKDDHVEVWVEEFTGVLANHFQDAMSAVKNALRATSRKVRLPVPAMQSSISQIIDGLLHLKAVGKYHGNFSFNNTLYHMSGNEVVVKLTGFQKKDGRMSVLHQLLKDFHSVGDELKSMAKDAVESKGYDTHLIDDLAQKLKDLTIADLPYIDQEIRAHPFFWDVFTMKDFFATQIPYHMNRGTFKTKIARCMDLWEKSATCSWSADGFDGFVCQMDNYRTRRLRKSAYDKKSPLAYVKFLSGLFVHENELKGSVSIYSVVSQRSSQACVKLYNLMPRPSRVQQT